MLGYSHTPLGSPFIPEYEVLFNIIINGYLENPVALIAEEEEEDKYFLLPEHYDSVGTILMEFTKY
jgi:hypothetical protein